MIDPGPATLEYVLHALQLGRRDLAFNGKYDDFRTACADARRVAIEWEAVAAVFRDGNGWALYLDEDASKFNSPAYESDDSYDEEPEETDEEYMDRVEQEEIERAREDAPGKWKTWADLNALANTLGNPANRRQP